MKNIYELVAISSILSNICLGECNIELNVSYKPQLYKMYYQEQDCSDKQELLERFLSFYPDRTIEEYNFTYVEFAKNIEIVSYDERQYAIYLDFDGNNGYTIIDDDNIYLFEPFGDLPSLREGNDVKFSLHSGFVFENEYNYAQLDSRKEISSTNSSGVSWNDIDGAMVDTVIDSGQYTINEYMANKYPTYTLEEEKYLRNYKVSKMGDNSQFVEKRSYVDEDGNEIRSIYYSEGNCTINSMYSYFYNLPKVLSFNNTLNSFNENFNNGNIEINVSDYFKDGTNEDTLYTRYKNFSEDINQIINGEEYNKKYIVAKKENELTKISKLYWDIRQEAVKYGYDPLSGFDTGSYAKNVMENVAEIYGYSNFTVNVSLALDEVLDNLHSGIPVVMATGGSKTYSGHGMTIYGYRKYSYEVTKFLWIKETKYAYIWCLDDGWSTTGTTNKKWFDPNCGSSNCYIVTTVSSLVFPSC